MRRIEGVHFDSNVFIRAAADPAVRETLLAVAARARVRRLRVAYSPIVALEVFSGAYKDDPALAERVQPRLEAIAETCGDDVLPAPAEIISGIVSGICSSRCRGDSKLASLVRPAASDEKKAILLLGKRANKAKLFVRNEFVLWTERMRSRLSAMGNLEQQLRFLRGSAWPDVFYSDIAAKTSASLVQTATTHRTGLLAIDAHFTAYTQLLEDMVRYRNFNADKHRNDSEDIQLLIYAACGLVLITYDRRIARWVAACSQADMVWHFDEALERLEALA